MTAEQLSLIAGAMLSFVFSYVPGVSPWFAGLRSEYKRLLMAGLLLLSAAVVMALSCSSWGAGWGIELTCDQPGLQVLIQAFVWALISNQATYLISPETRAVRQAQLERDLSLEMRSQPEDAVQ